MLSILVLHPLAVGDVEHGADDPGVATVLGTSLDHAVGLHPPVCSVGPEHSVGEGVGGTLLEGGGDRGRAARQVVRVDPLLDRLGRSFELGRIDPGDPAGLLRPLDQDPVRTDVPDPAPDVSDRLRGLEDGAALAEARFAPPKLLLCPLAIRHVLQVHHDSTDARLVEEVSRSHLHHAVVAVGMASAELHAFLAGCVLQGRKDPSLDDREIVGVDEVAGRLAHEALWLVAEERPGRRRDVLEHARVGDVDEVRARFHEEPVPSFACGEGLLCLLAVGDVPEDGDVVPRPAVSRRAEVRVPDRPVRSVEHELAREAPRLAEARPCAGEVEARRGEVAGRLSEQLVTRRTEELERRVVGLDVPAVVVGDEDRVVRSVEQRPELALRERRVVRPSSVDAECRDRGARLRELALESDDPLLGGLRGPAHHALCPRPSTTDSAPSSISCGGMTQAHQQRSRLR